MDKMLRYKNYHTEVKHSPEDDVFHGKIEGIEDLVLFESESESEVEEEFHKAVDEYLEFKNLGTV